jgi:hypothetical protein
MIVSVDKASGAPAAAPKLSPLSLPADLAAVALIPAKTCAAIGSVSLSWWHSEVAAGRAPLARIKQPRFTRWKAADVIEFWAARAESAANDASAAELLTLRAKKASAAACAKRAGVTAAKAVAIAARLGQ